MIEWEHDEDGQSSYAIDKDSLRDVGNVVPHKNNESVRVGSFFVYFDFDESDDARKFVERLNDYANRTADELGGK